MPASNRVVSPAICAFAAGLVLGAPAARADWMDSLNPTNWFGKDKYEQKLIQDPPANDLYKKGVVEMEKRDYEGSPRPSPSSRRRIRTRSTSAKVC